MTRERVVPVSDRDRAPPFPIVGLLAWFLILAVAFLASQSGADLRAIGVVTMAYGSWAFLKAGGRAVDVAGLWGLALALFSGVAAFVMPAQQHVSDKDVMLTALLLSVTASSAVLVFTWWRSASRPPVQPAKPWISLPAPVLLTLGFVALVVGLGVQSVGPLVNLAEGFIWVSPLFVTLGVASRSRRSWAGLLLIALTIGLVFLAWDGGGRLLMLAMSVGCVLVYTYRADVHSYWIKVGITASMFPALIVAGFIETNRRGYRGERLLLEVPSNFALGDGLHSMWSPLIRFADIIRDVESGQLVTRGFDTLFATIVIWIPRPFWPTKPEGWGRELAWAYRPQSAGAMGGYSEAAVFPAELYWSFGLLGVLVGVMLTAWLVWSVARSLMRQRRVRLPKGVGSVGLIGWSVASAGVLTFFWGGLFTTVGRVAQQSLAMALLCMIGVPLSHLLGYRDHQRNQKRNPHADAWCGSSTPDPESMLGAPLPAGRQVESLES